MKTEQTLGMRLFASCLNVGKHSPRVSAFHKHNLALQPQRECRDRAGETGQRVASLVEAPGALLTQSPRARQEELLSPDPLDDGPPLLAAEREQVLGGARAVVEDDVLGGEGQTQEVAVHGHGQGLLRRGHLPDNLDAVLVHQEDLDGPALDRDDAHLHAEGVLAHRVLVQGEGRGPLDAGARGHGLQAQHVDQADAAVAQHQQPAERRRSPQLAHRLLETQVSVQLPGGRERGRPTGRGLLLQQEAEHEAVAGAHVEVPAAALHTLQRPPVPVAQQLLPLDGGDQGEGLGAHHAGGGSEGWERKGRLEERVMDRTVPGVTSKHQFPVVTSEKGNHLTLVKNTARKTSDLASSRRQTETLPGEHTRACK